MTDRPDMRTLLVFGSLSDVTTGDAALVEADAALPESAVTARFQATEPVHAAGCACCRSRTGAAEALGLLFLARARGGQGWFQRVVAVVTSEAGREAVSRALTEDVFAAARFRLEEPGATALPHPPVQEGAA